MSAHRPAEARGARTVACPACGARVAWLPESRFRPFCSERCRAMDFGAWATERYRLAAGADDGAGAARDDDADAA